MNIKMNSKTVCYGMIGVFALLVIGLLATAYIGEKVLSKQADKLTALKLDNELLDQQQTALVKANKDLVKYAELGNLAKSIVPQDKDQAKTVREILNIAAANDIPLTAISFPASTLGSKVPVAATTPASGATTTPVAPSVSQVTPVKGVTGLYQMQIIVQSNSNDPRPYNNVQNFLAQLEQNRRTAQVSQLVITPNTKDIRLLSFTLTINVFVRP